MQISVLGIFAYCLLSFEREMKQKLGSPLLLITDILRKMFKLASYATACALAHMIRLNDVLLLASFQTREKICVFSKERKFFWF